MKSNILCLQTIYNVKLKISIYLGHQIKVEFFNLA